MIKNCVAVVPSISYTKNECNNIFLDIIPFITIPLYRTQKIIDTAHNFITIIYHCI